MEQDLNGNAHRTQPMSTYPPSEYPWVNLQIHFRQMQVSIIFDLGNLLELPRHCTDTAIVYMHRFYMFRDTDRFLPQRVCAVALFQACKATDVRRPLRYLIRFWIDLFRSKNSVEPDSTVVEHYANDFTVLEAEFQKILLLPLPVEHLHDIIPKMVDRIKDQIRLPAGTTWDDLIETARRRSRRINLLTPFCVQYSLASVACFCIQTAITWLQCEILSEESTTNNELSALPWFSKIDQSVTKEQIEEISRAYYKIVTAYLDECARKESDPTEQQRQILLNATAFLPLCCFLRRNGSLENALNGDIPERASTKMDGSPNLSSSAEPSPVPQKDGHQKPVPPMPADRSSGTSHPSATAEKRPSQVLDKPAELSKRPRAQ